MAPVIRVCGVKPCTLATRAAATTGHVATRAAFVLPAGDAFDADGTTPHLAPASPFLPQAAGIAVRLARGA